MDSPQGKILSFVDDAPGRRAMVDVGASAACPRCAAGKGCGAGLFATQNERRCLEALIPDGLHCAVGDIVEVSLTTDNVFRAALVVYGLPMSGAIVAAAIAFALALTDSAAVAVALGGLMLGLAIARQHLNRLACLRRFVPTISRRLQDDGSGA